MLELEAVPHRSMNTALYRRSLLSIDSVDLPSSQCKTHFLVLFSYRLCVSFQRQFSCPLPCLYMDMDDYPQARLAVVFYD
jgi:hypothetical protein